MTTPRPNKPVLAGLMRGVQPPAPEPGPAPVPPVPQSPVPQSPVPPSGGTGLGALVEAARARRAPAAAPSRAVTVRLPVGLLERVDRLVFETGVKMQDFFERALEAAVEAVEAALPRRR